MIVYSMLSISYRMEEKINEIVEKTFKNIIKIEGTFESNKNTLSDDIHNFAIELLKEYGITIHKKQYKFLFHYNQNGKKKIFEVKSAPTELAARVVYFYNLNIMPFKIERLELS